MSGGRSKVKLVANSIRNWINARLAANNVMQFEFNVRLVEPLREIHRAYKANVKFTSNI